MAVDCSKFWINRELYYKLQGMANPCNMKNWLGPQTLADQGTVGKVYKAPITLKGLPNLRAHYIIKTLHVNESSNLEKKVMRMISDDMLIGAAPLLFPFLYLDYVCENTLHLVMQPAEVSLGAVISSRMSMEWWIEVLYQLSRAVEYLERKKINHNDLTFENIMFQNVSRNPNDIALMLIDFGSAVQGYPRSSRRGFIAPNFVLGRDMNYFLYILIFNRIIPDKLSRELYPLLAWEEVRPIPGEDPYILGLRRANLSHDNWNTSGEYLSKRFSSL